MSIKFIRKMYHNLCWIVKFFLVSLSIERQKKEKKNIKKQLTELRKNIYILSCVRLQLGPCLAAMCVINPIFWNLRQTTRSTIMLNALNKILHFDRIFVKCLLCSVVAYQIFIFLWNGTNVKHFKVIYSSPWFLFCHRGRCNYCLESYFNEKPLQTGFLQNSFLLQKFPMDIPKIFTKKNTRKIHYIFT